jgi:hypothetical protein
MSRSSKKRRTLGAIDDAETAGPDVMMPPFEVSAVD